MAKPADILTKAIDDVSLEPGTVEALFDENGRCLLGPESELHDYKQQLLATNRQQEGELARDVLGFFNANGGLLLCGVTDQGLLVGRSGRLKHDEFRKKIRAYTGSQPNPVLEHYELTRKGRQYSLAVVTVPRSQRTYPSLLCRSIAGKLGRVKYRSGTMFYRDGPETRSTSDPDEIVAIARSLAFTYSFPRHVGQYRLLEDSEEYRIFDHINRYFLGREQETGLLLHEIRANQPRFVSITGEGGIGKTEVAIHLTHQLRTDRNFRYIFSATAKREVFSPAGYVPLSPEFSDLDTLLDLLARWMALPELPGDQDAAAEAVSAALESRGYGVVLLDNLESVWDRKEVLDFIERIGRAALVISTSRIQIFRKYAYPYRLGQMDDLSAARLFRREVRALGKRDAADRPIEQILTLFESVGKNPLAIRWLAWREAKGLEAVPATIPNLERLQKFCLDDVYEALSEGGQHVLRALSICLELGEGTVAALAATCNLLPEETYELLQELLDCSMLVIDTFDAGLNCDALYMPIFAREYVRTKVRERGEEATFVRRFQAHQRQKRDGSEKTDADAAAFAQLDYRSVRFAPRTWRERTLSRALEYARKYPHEWRFFRIAAECHRHTGNELSSLDQYEACVRLMPHDHPDAASTRLETATMIVRCHGHDRQRLLEAMTLLTEAKDMSPEEPRIVIQLAETHARLDHPEDCREFLASASQIIRAREKDLPPTATQKYRAHVERVRSLVEDH